MHFRGEGSGERGEGRGAARGSALDIGWVACGEKLNRSLCSLKIKLFLDAGGVDCGLFNARLR